MKKKNGLLTIINTNHLGDGPRLLTYREVGQILHLSKRQIQNYLLDGRLKSTKIGNGKTGRRLIFRSSVEELIENGIDQ